MKEEKKTAAQKEWCRPAERIGLGLGDMGMSFGWVMVSLYISYFFTDVVGLSVGAVATLLIVARIWDGINDPLTGLVVDRTRTRWGSCRPWLLWCIIPNALFAILLFSDMGKTDTAKLVIAYIGYLLYCAAYSMIATPLTAILPSMTNNYAERTKVMSVRMIISRVATLIVTLFGMRMVMALGRGNEARGFTLTMSVFGVLSAIMLLIAFFTVRERFPFASQEHVPLKTSVRALKGNWPWLVILILNIINMIGISMFQQTVVYTVKYVLKMPGFPLIIFFVAGTFLGMLTSIKLASRFKKRDIHIVGSAIYFVGLTGGFIFTGNITLPLLIAFTVIGGVGLGITTPITFSMLADAAEYGAWKNHVTATGLTFTAATFGTKVGTSIGGAAGLLVMSAGGYVANAAQTPEAINAIRLSGYVIPALSCLGAIVCLLFYKLDKQYPQIKAELDARRALQSTRAESQDDESLGNIINKTETA